MKSGLVSNPFIYYLCPIANIEPKRAAKRQRYGEDLEENRAAKRQRYGEDLEENRAAKRQRYGEDLEENRAVKRQRYQESVEENRAAKRRIYRGNSATIKAARMSRYWKGRRTTTTTTTTTQRYVIACCMYHLKSKGCYARGSWLPVMHTLTLLYACMTYYQMYSIASYTGCSLVKVNVCTKGYLYMYMHLCLLHCKCDVQ